MGVIPAMQSVRAGITKRGSHAIGHQLGPLGVGHSNTSCIVCPAVMKYNIRHGISNLVIQQEQDKIGKILWHEPVVAKLYETKSLDKENAD
jgi:alcohol dehydrogenase class IV